jgi:multiple sugar transport system permease protein
MIKIAVPIALPSIATVVILTFLTTWKEYMFAFVNSATDASKTITVGISMLTQDYGNRWDLMSAAGSVCIAPVLVIAICFQKYIIKGMTLGAVKG